MLLLELRILVPTILLSLNVLLLLIRLLVLNILLRLISSTASIIIIGVLLIWLLLTSSPVHHFKIFKETDGVRSHVNTVSSIFWPDNTKVYWFHVLLSLNLPRLIYFARFNNRRSEPSLLNIIAKAIIPTIASHIHIVLCMAWHLSNLLLKEPQELLLNLIL